MTEKISPQALAIATGVGAVLGLVVISGMSPEHESSTSAGGAQMVEPVAAAASPPSDDGPSAREQQRRAAMERFFQLARSIEEERGGVSLNQLNQIADIAGIKQYGEMNRKDYLSVAGAMGKLSLGQLNLLATAFGLNASGPASPSGSAYGQYQPPQFASPAPANMMPMGRATYPQQPAYANPYPVGTYPGSDLDGSQSYSARTRQAQQNYRAPVTGNQYQYDLTNPVDAMRYEVDPMAQLRDEIDPRVEMDREFGYQGGGITR